MKNKIMIMTFFLAVSTLASASWWGNLSKGERASVIATGIIATQNRYNNSNNNYYPNNIEIPKEQLQEVPVPKKEEYIPRPNPNKPIPITVEVDKRMSQNEGTNKYMSAPQATKNNESTDNSTELTEKDIIEIRQKIEAGSGNIIEMNDGRVIQIDDEGYPHIVK